MTDPAAKGRELFESGYYCAESVLLALGEHLGVSKEFFPRIASGFCSGVARTSGMCGALSGAIMALGLQFGRDVPEDSPDHIYSRVAKLLEMFRAEFGSINCEELLGESLATEEARKRLHENKIIATRCPRFTAGAAGIALSLLEEG